MPKQSMVRGSARGSVIAAALSLVVGLAGTGGAYPRPGQTILISRASIQLPAGPAQDSTYSSVSASGRFVAFDSLSPTIVVPDKNPGRDVFVYDRKLDKTELISVSSTDLQSVGESTRPAISPDGRFVAFISEAPTLVDGDTNLASDIFVHDRRTGSTERVSVSVDGSEAALGSSSDKPSISSDGRFISFSSASPDLVQDDTNAVKDVFVRDRKKDVTTRVSVGPDGAQANGASSCSSISGSGRYLAFNSGATNLVQDDTNQSSDAFIRDLHTGENELVSVATDGTQAAMGGGTCGSDVRSISSDGSVVAFSSASSNLVPNDVGVGGLDTDVFVRDRKTGRTELIGVTSFGEEPTGSTRLESFSANGRYATFYSDAGDLFCCDTGSSIEPVPYYSDFDVFIHDLRDGSTEVVSIGHDGKEASGCNRSQYSGYSVHSSISETGRFVSFMSCAGNLEANDESGHDFDIYLRDFGASLGIGGLGIDRPGNEPNDPICISPDVCIPPGRAHTRGDQRADLSPSLTGQGANLYGASLAYRPQYGDLFAAIELEHMPKVIPGVSPIFYGLRFHVEDKSYEVRATSLNYGTFGLFDCTDAAPLCTKVADLRGGYGTTGMRVVFSVPLEEIGLEAGGRLRGLEAFSGLGSYLTGASKVLDRVRLK